MAGRVGGVSREDTVEVEALVGWLCILSIVIRMCERNEMHLLTVKELEMVSRGLRGLFLMEKLVLGLLLPDCMMEE